MPRAKVRKLSWPPSPFVKVYSPGQRSALSQGRALRSPPLKEHVKQEKGDAGTKETQRRAVFEDGTHHQGLRCISVADREPSFDHEVPLECHVATQKGFEKQLSDKQEPSTSPLQAPWSEPLRAVTQQRAGSFGK